MIINAAKASNSFGVALRRAGRLAEAVSVYRLAREMLTPAANEDLFDVNVTSNKLLMVPRLGLRDWG